MDQRSPIDSGTAVAYLDAKFSVLADNRDSDGPIRYTVVDCICDEVPNQLLHAFPVPRPPAVAHDFQLQRAAGIYDAQLLQFLLADFAEIHRRPNDVDAKPEIRPVEIDKVIQESLQVSAAADQPLRGSRDFGSGVELPEMQGRHLHRLQGASHVMAEHSEQQVSSLVHLRAEMADGLGERLIDGLVEPNH